MLQDPVSQWPDFRGKNKKREKYETEKVTRPGQKDLLLHKAF